MLHKQDANTGPTPGPYEAEQGRARGAWVSGSNGEWICLVCGDTDESARANIHVVLDALNHHNPLVLALESALLLIANRGLTECEAYRQGTAALHAVRVRL